MPVHDWTRVDAGIFHIDVPLESTYQQAFHSMPSYWRDILQR